MAMIMIAVAAVGTSGTFALADTFDSQSDSTTKDSQAMFGHVEATVYDEDGNIKAYTQSDNKIVNNGLDMIMVNTFAGTPTGGIANLGPASNIQLGSATAEETLTAAKTITAIASCAPDTFTGVSAGGGAAITLTSTFTSADDGAGCLTTIGEAGLFNGATGSGTDSMFAQNKFASTVTLSGTDSLVVNWSFTFTDN